MTIQKTLQALIFLAFVSCNKNETIIDGGGGVNVPSVASAENAFGYSINAQRLSTSQTFSMTFTKNRLNIAAAVSNVSNGRAIFTILNQANSVIHSDTFRLAGMYQVVMLIGLPASISIAFQDFTGSIQYAVTGDTLLPGHADEFPNARGSQWTYSRYDSMTSTRDTVLVTVFGQVTLENIPLTLWQRVLRSRTDTVYVSIAGDTVRVFDHPFSVWDNSKYVFPLQVDKRWKGDSISDTSTVTRSGTVSTPAGQFNNGFLVEEDWGAFNDYGHFETWLVPRVGLVKQYRRQFGRAFVRETWELLSYHINTVIE